MLRPQRTCGVSGVIIEVPIGQPKLDLQFKWNWERVLSQSVKAINRARALGLHVVFFPYDTTRARLDDLQNLLTGLMQEARPDSIGVIDTTCCAIPSAIKFLVSLVRKLTNLPVEIHTHNDIGMAVANEMAAVEAGAIGSPYLCERDRRENGKRSPGRGGGSVENALWL